MTLEDMNSIYQFHLKVGSTIQMLEQEIAKIKDEKLRLEARLRKFEDKNIESLAGKEIENVGL